MMMIRLRKTKSVASRSGWLSREGSRGNATRYDYLRPGIIRRSGINNLTIIDHNQNQDCYQCNIGQAKRRSGSFAAGGQADVVEEEGEEVLKDNIMTDIKEGFIQRRLPDGGFKVNLYKKCQFCKSKRCQFNEVSGLYSGWLCPMVKIDNKKKQEHAVNQDRQSSKSDLRTHCSQKSGDFVLFLFDGISVFIMPERQLCEICHFLQAHSIEKHTNLRWKK